MLYTQLLELEAEVAELRRQRSASMEEDAQPVTSPSEVHVTSATLLGIFSHLGSNETMELRRRSRVLLRRHPLACSSQEYQERQSHHQCQLVYIFVVGGRTEGPTETLVEPFTLDEVERRKVCQRFPLEPDCLEPDTTFLNVKENTHEGITLTWLAFAAQLAEALGFAFVAKMTSDTMLYIDEFFDFVRYGLYLAPFHNNMMVGSIIDRTGFMGAERYFDKSLSTWIDRRNVTEEETIRWNEQGGMFWKKFGYPLHFYPEGHFYLLSVGLCKAIVRVAGSRPSYLEGVEDQDIGLLVMLGVEEPITVVAVAEREKFWLPGVQVGSRRHDMTWELEVARLKRISAGG